jgi:hypothetical protein
VHEGDVYPALLRERVDVAIERERVPVALEKEGGAAVEGAHLTKDRRGAAAAAAEQNGEFVRIPVPALLDEETQRHAPGEGAAPSRVDGDRAVDRAPAQGRAEGADVEQSRSVVAGIAEDGALGRGHPGVRGVVHDPPAASLVELVVEDILRECARNQDRRCRQGHGPAKHDAPSFQGEDKS